MRGTDGQIQGKDDGWEPRRRIYGKKPGPRDAIGSFLDSDLRKRSLTELLLAEKRGTDRGFSDLAAVMRMLRFSLSLMVRVLS